MTEDDPSYIAGVESVFLGLTKTFSKPVHKTIKNDKMSNIIYSTLKLEKLN